MFDRQQSIRRVATVDISSTDYTLPTNSPSRAVYIGTGGTIVVQFVDEPGVSRTYTVLSGSRHPWQLSKVIRSGTTASGIVAEF